MPLFTASDLINIPREDLAAKLLEGVDVSAFEVRYYPDTDTHEVKNTEKVVEDKPRRYDFNA